MTVHKIARPESTYQVLSGISIKESFYEKLKENRGVLESSFIKMDVDDFRECFENGFTQSHFQGVSFADFELPPSYEYAKNIHVHAEAPETMSLLELEDVINAVKDVCQDDCKVTFSFEIGEYRKLIAIGNDERSM